MCPSKRLDRRQSPVDHAQSENITRINVICQLFCPVDTWAATMVSSLINVIASVSPYFRAETSQDTVIALQQLSAF